MLLGALLIAAISVGSVQQPAANGHAATVRAFVEAFNAQDVERMLTLATADIEWISVDGVKLSTETAGKEALRASMTAYFKSCPTCRSAVVTGAATANRIATVETASWTGTAGPRTQQGLAVYEFKDGLIGGLNYFPAER